MKFTSTPAWTMLPRRSVLGEHGSPGPGTYSPSPSKTSPAYSLGTSARPAGVQSNLSPGPGAYDPLEGKGATGHAMSRSSRDLNMSAPNLGPGAYDIPSFGVEGPAYTMGLKTPTKVRDNDGPGPGAYDQTTFKSVKHRSPSTSFPTTGHKTLDGREDSPGPGAYTPPPHSSRSAIFGTVVRTSLASNTQVPGPGAYPSPLQKDGPKYTFLPRRDRSPNDSTPGPGAYNVNHLDKFKAREPVISMGTGGRREKEREESPGPGQYNTSGRGLGGPKWSLGSKPRGDLNATTPAPGSYEIPTTIHKGGFTMGGKATPMDSSSGPGPGAYLSTSLRTSSPGFKVGKSSRVITSKSRDKSPGPGAYTPTKLHSAPSASFGKDRRQSLPGPERTPGPGAYHLLRDSVVGPKYSMQGRSQRDLGEKTPGPGQYDLSKYEKVRDKAPGVVMGKGGRGPSHTRSLSDIPGPGGYALPEKRGGPKWAFGQQEKLAAPASDTPAPGTYDISQSHSQRGFTMAGKESRRERDSIPGPGAYHSDIIRSGSPAFSMGTKQQPAPVKQEVPGPGAYDPGLQHPIPTHSFGTARKSSPSFGPETPGPGSYDYPKESTGPVFSMAAREERDPDQSSPGPGHYDTSKYDRLKSRPQTAKIGTEPRSRERKEDPVPGPGQYDPASKQQGPIWGFGSEQRDKQGENSGPSPGSYDVGDMRTSQAYSISGKPISPKADASPGPGSYDPPLSKAAPAYSMNGKRGRIVGQAVENIGPGPGKYTPVLKGASPGIKFGSGRSNATLTSTPGPGAYDRSSSIGKGSPGYSIRGRQTEVKEVGVPGPGRYSPKDVLGSSAPAHPFGKEPRDPKFGQTGEGAGPGLYYSPLKTTPPIWKFGSEPKDRQPLSGSPGPGQYDIKPSVPDVAPYALSNK